MRGAAVALLCVVLCGAGVGGAATARAEERIRTFRVEIELAPDGRFTVEERLLYDFGDARKRGIYRDIPVRYERSGTPDYGVALEVLSVTDGAGNARPWRETREGRDVRIRIGDPDRTVSGPQEYWIRYRVRRAILWLDQHDELYWNATGNGWAVPIEAASVRVRGPRNALPDDLRLACFTGPLGTQGTDCESSHADGEIAFATRRSLAAGEGLTLAVALPKGLLAEPSALSRFLDRASDWLSPSLGIPLLTFLGMGGLWWHRGRDPVGPDAVPVRYEPPDGMSPAELGTVLDESVDMRDITATLLDLTVRGYLEIEEIETTRFLFLKDSDYTLHERNADPARLKEHERLLLAGLLGGNQSVRVSELKDHFYTRIPGIREALYREVSRDAGWFPTSPERVRNRYLAAGAITGVLGMAALPFGAWATGLSLLGAAAIVVGWGRVMPRRTRAGRRARQHILGFQEFLERVEVDRLERLGKRSVAEFERLLPFAFVLGAADAWAQAFADLYTEPPSWFRSHHGGPFRPRSFVADVGRSLDSVGSAMASRPRSSGGSGSSGFGGGGFSGGGFGGGGGGSW